MRPYSKGDPTSSPSESSCFPIWQLCCCCDIGKQQDSGDNIVGDQSGHYSGIFWPLNETLLQHSVMAFVSSIYVVINFFISGSFCSSFVFGQGNVCKWSSNKRKIKINYNIYTVGISFNTTKELPLRVKIFAFHPRHSKHSITFRPPAPPWEKDTAFLLTWHHRWWHFLWLISYSRNNTNGIEKSFLK